MKSLSIFYRQFYNDAVEDFIPPSTSISILSSEMALTTYFGLHIAVKYCGIHFGPVHMPTIHFPPREPVPRNDCFQLASHDD